MTGFRDQLAVAVQCEGLHLRERVLMAMIALSSSGGLAWPSVESLSKMTGARPRRVRRALRQLADRGLIHEVGKTDYCQVDALRLQAARRGAG